MLHTLSLYGGFSSEYKDAQLILGFVKIDIWISLSCYMDLSKLICRDTTLPEQLLLPATDGMRISLSLYLDLSKLVYGFLSVVTWICLN